MNTFSIPEPLEVEAANETVKPEWRTPVITRIDIKRTMLKTGSFIDGSSHTIISG
ncbi:MAG: hypothetical protein WCK35_01075 [Chloroflexota bacterium]